ncbi:MAG: hypothetical protein LHV69_06435 [Elusimicrobia bacterium]|nr:hypothetical protein [Candidatus Obscuribacterium magneticum]
MRRQYLPRPRFQISFSFFFLLGALVIIGVLGGSTLLNLHLIGKSSFVDPAYQPIFRQQVESFRQFFLWNIITFPLFFFVLGVYLSYRLIGPLKRIESWLELHLLGVEPPYLKTRKGDELEPIVRTSARIFAKYAKKFKRNP